MMTMLKRMPWWAMVLALLAAVDLGWRCWSWMSPRSICTTATSISGKPFLMLADHRSNVDVFSLRRDKEWEAVYAEMDMNNDGKVDTMMHYLDGRDVFNVHLQPGQKPKFDVYFYGPDKSVTWWVDRNGVGAFTDRFFYDADGKLSRHDVLLGQTWRDLVARGQKNGVVLDGQWVPLQLTGSGWSVEKMP